MKDFTSLPAKIFPVARGLPEGSSFTTNCRPETNGRWNAHIDRGNVLVRGTATLAKLGIGVWLGLSQSGLLVLSCWRLVGRYASRVWRRRIRCLTHRWYRLQGKRKLIAVHNLPILFSIRKSPIRVAPAIFLPGTCIRRCRNGI